MTLDEILSTGVWIYIAILLIAGGVSALREVFKRGRR